MDSANIKRNEQETEYEYIYRICSLKDTIGTWYDVADVLNRELGYEYTEAKYRKQYQSFQKMFEENRKQFIVASDSLHNAGASCAAFDEQMRELKKERIKLQTEKLEYNRWLRDNARDELMLEKINEAVSSLNVSNPIVAPIVGDDIAAYYNDSDQTGILCYGDEHFGAEFEIRGLDGSIINKYNSAIFYDRMETVLSVVVQKAKRMGLRKIKVFSFGDELDGIIRISQLMNLEFGVIESAMKYAEYMSSWLNRLTEFFEVEFQMTEGNHTELRLFSQPKGAFKNENMSKIIKEFIKVRLASNPRFSLIENETGFIYDIIYGQKFLGIHGEEKDMENAIKDFSTMFDVNIDVLIGGHKHHHAGECVGLFKEVINVPSVMGTDPFAISLKRTSSPGALFLVAQDGLGIVEQHNIKFVI